MKRVRIVDGSKAANFYAAEEVDAELEALRAVEAVAQYIVSNRNNFTDKHPMVHIRAEQIIDLLAAALAEYDVLKAGKT